MKRTSTRPLMIRILAALSTLLLFGSVVYVMFAGIGHISAALLAVAAVGLAAPCVAASSSVLEFLSELFGMIMEGIQAIFDAILGIFNI